MNENQKCGVIIMVLSFLLILLALVVSQGGMPNLGYLENFVLLEIKPVREFEIYIPTKYVVLFFISSAAYGFTTYLGITTSPQICKGI